MGVIFEVSELYVDNLQRVR